MAKKKKKKFKGKYKGPDRFKGNKKKIKHWKNHGKYKGMYIGPDRFKGNKKKIAKWRKKKKSAKVTAANPPPPPKQDTSRIIKTNKTSTQTLSNSFFDTSVDQNREILNAFLAFSGTELYQYTNLKSIDGKFNDVSIIGVLSSRRKDSRPNDIIDLYPPSIRGMYRGVGVPEEVDKLYIDVDSDSVGSITLDFYIEEVAIPRIKKMGSANYV